jgi:hypothetical protein
MALNSPTVLPPDFTLAFRTHPDSLPLTAPEVGYSANVNLVHGNIGKTVSSRSYRKFDINPNGLTGDKFRFYPFQKWWPTGNMRDGYCDLIIEGEWIHPDTLSTVIRMEYCSPETMPEKDNLFRVKFARVN